MKVAVQRATRQVEDAAVAHREAQDAHREAVAEGKEMAQEVGGC
jgi:hypothetical protein